MSEIKVNKISPRSGTDVTLGDSGDTFTLGSGANIAGLTLSDNILFDTASKGIYLGVTSATAANLLDDYEEGTWTSSFSSATNASSLILSRAKYIKVGNKVTLFGRIEGSITSTATETRWELIMPFNAYSNDYAASGAISIFVGSFSQDRVANGVMLNGSGDASKIVFYFSGTNIVKSGAFTAGDFTLTYESA